MQRSLINETEFHCSAVNFHKVKFKGSRKGMIKLERNLVERYPCPKMGTKGEDNKLEDTYYLTLGSDIGGIDAANAVEPHLRVLKPLLYKYCNKNYSELKQLAPILRIDGKVTEFGFEGCEKLRLYKKQGYITVDIGMPKSRWENKSDFEIRRYLINKLEEALHLFLTKLNKEKINLNEEQLFNDLNKVKVEFLTN
ncbi:hypothetical protein ACFVHQ_01485 [Actinomycetes bacterium NPDC127524]